MHVKFVKPVMAGGDTASVISHQSSVSVIDRVSDCVRACGGIGGVGGIGGAAGANVGFAVSIFYKKSFLDLLFKKFIIIIIGREF